MQQSNCVPIVHDFRDTAT